MGSGAESAGVASCAQTGAASRSVESSRVFMFLKFKTPTFDEKNRGEKQKRGLENCKNEGAKRQRARKSGRKRAFLPHPFPSKASASFAVGLLTRRVVLGPPSQNFSRKFQ